MSCLHVGTGVTQTLRLTNAEVARFASQKMRTSVFPFSQIHLVLCKG